MDQLTAQRIARALERIADSLTVLSDKALLALVEAKRRELEERTVLRPRFPAPGTAAE